MKTISLIACIVFLGATFLTNDASARDRRPWYRCMVNVNGDGSIVNVNCKSGNIVVANIPQYVNTATVASRLCQYQHQIVTFTKVNGGSTISCVFSTKRING